MIILCDEKIPCAIEAFSGFGNVRMTRAEGLTADGVGASNVLLVRSGTRVGSRLLDGTSVRFVGSPTAGTDHVDRRYLEERGIFFAHAPGCNADSVVEYVLAAILRTALRQGTNVAGKVLGIVGHGAIGERLGRRALALGMDVLLNDPPKKARSGGAYVELAELLGASDIVSLHVPLTAEGPHPTVHLLNATSMRLMKHGAWLINASRGGVVSGEALRRYHATGAIGAVVLDVWENEPDIHTRLLDQVDVGTPHIAGYSYDGKINGTIVIYRALESFLGQQGAWDVEAVVQPTPDDRLDITPPAGSHSDTEWLSAVVEQMYRIEADDLRFREEARRANGATGRVFKRLRRTYPRRRSFSFYRIRSEAVPASLRTAVSEGLRVKLI